MKVDQYPDNPYLLLTPGPLSTTKSVKEAMLQDWCTWDDDYNRIVQQIYDLLKEKGFVIYPGKVTDMDTFRIGNIGDIHPADVTSLLKALESSMYWKKSTEPLTV